MAKYCNLDFPLMLYVWLKLPVVDRIQPQSNKFAMGVEKKAAVDSKLNENSEQLRAMLTKLASLSPVIHFLISGPTAAPARIPQNTSTIIAKP